jgi:hypothetical protein
MLPYGSRLASSVGVRLCQLHPLVGLSPFTMRPTTLIPAARWQTHDSRNIVTTCRCCYFLVHQICLPRTTLPQGGSSYAASGGS